MCPDPIARCIQMLPNVELHVQLKGATDAATVWKMAQRNGVSIPAQSLDERKRAYSFCNFEHLFQVYSAAVRAMCTPMDWELMVERVVEPQAAQNIVCSEVFVSASHQVKRSPLDEWIAAIATGASAAEQRFNAVVRLIVDISRHLPETQDSVLRCASDTKKTGYFIVLGFGRFEDGFPAGMFEETYQEARQQGLHVVAHTGETTGAKASWEALQVLRAERSGHGIRVLDDAELIAHVREMRVPFEVCPTSNYCLGVTNRNEPHSIRRMVNAGLLCTVNSDDPPMFGTSLFAEFKLLANQDFTWNELFQLNMNAVESSFLDNASRVALRERIGRATNYIDKEQ